ncbi:MAG: nucleoporin-interacting protein [Bacillaceae bacterium]|nr:nucleoporin-interacting protein [Bacillaceae bacterium]
MKRTVWFGLFAILIMTFAWRLFYISPYASTWDQVDFVLALERFDLLSMQPHFPGYPYFILGGRLFHLWLEDPVTSLSVLNVVLAMTAVIPVYLLARRRFQPVYSLFISLMVQAPAYLWILTAQPVSEGTALAILWWYWWGLAKALDNRTWYVQLLPLFLFGLLMGVRLSWFPFGLGILFLWIYDAYRHWEKPRRQVISRLLFYMMAATFFQLLWIGGLVQVTGSIRGFVKLALAFVTGHFEDWGGAVSSSSLTFVERLSRLLFDDIIWTGWFADSVIVAFVTGGFFLASAASVLSFRRRDGWARTPRLLPSFDMWMVIMCLVYLIWVLLAQNVEKPRHISPLIGPVFYMATAAVLGVARSRMALMLPVLVLVVQSVAGMIYTYQQTRELPATYQLAQEVEKWGDDVVVYTWEETRVLQYLDVDYTHRRLYTYDLFLYEMKKRTEDHVYVTGQVIEGFRAQGAELDGKIRKVGEFHSSPLFSPVYHTIELYEWIDR